MYVEALEKANLDLPAQRFGTYKEILKKLEKVPIKNVYVKRMPTPKKKPKIAPPKAQKKKAQPEPITQE